MNENIVTWGELPPPQDERPIHPTVLEQFDALKSRPGQWAIVMTGRTKRSVAETQAAFERHGFDATTRMRATGGTDLWACWKNNNEEN